MAAAGREKISPEFIQKQVEEFHIGKRHLANMMNEDPENFSQEDIDVRKLFISVLGYLQNRMWNRCVFTFTANVLHAQTASPSHYHGFH